MVFKKKARAVASRAAGAARRHYSSRGGARGIIGSLKPVLDGGIGQMASQVGNQFAPPWGGIAALAGAGYFLKNDTLKTLAGMSAANQFPIGNLLGSITGRTTTTTSGAVI